MIVVPKLNFIYFFCHGYGKRRRKRSPGINFYVFCHDHGVDVVSAGMKIYVFCHHHVVVNGIRKQILKK